MNYLILARRQVWPLAVLLSAAAAALWRIDTYPKNLLRKSEQRAALAISLVSLFLLILVSATVGKDTYVRHLETAQFYQYNFDPAVSLACTGKLQGIKASASLLEFLNLHTPNFSCDDLSEITEDGWTIFDEVTIYLYVLAAACWRILGISWFNLYPIASLFCVCFSLANYGFLRALGCGRLPSFFLALLAIFTLPVLSQIPHLRDFSKAPFLIGVTALLAASVVRQHKPLWQSGLFAFAAGAVTSIGLGFRSDMTIMLLVAGLTPLAMTGTVSLRMFVNKALLIWIGFGLGYLLLNLPPILLSPAPLADSPRYIWHVLTLGYAETFYQNALHMKATSYSTLRFYIDGLLAGSASLFHSGGNGIGFGYGQENYDEATKGLFFQTLWVTPYDFLLRVLYTINSIINGIAPVYLNGIGIVALLFFVFITNPTAALFLLLSAGVFMPVQSLQFDERHSFYMIFLAIGLLGLSLRGAGLVSKSFFLHDYSNAIRVVRARAFIFITLVVVVVASIALGGRCSLYMQNQALLSILRKYEAFDWVSVGRRNDINSVALEGVVPLTNEAWLDSDSLKASPQHRDAMTKSEEVSLNDTYRVIALFSKVTIKLDYATEAAPPFAFKWQADVGGAIRQAMGSLQVLSQNEGLIAKTRVFRADELPISHENRRLHLRLSVDENGGNFRIGLLQAEPERWISLVNIPAQAGEYIVSFDIPASMGSMRFAFDKNGGTSNSLNVKALELRTTGPCYARDAAVSAAYRYYSDVPVLLSSPQPLISGTSPIERVDPLQERITVAYYFPQTFFGPSVLFDHLTVLGIKPACIIDWSVAPNFPPGLLPVEMVTQNGVLDLSPRGSLKEALSDFIHRKPVATADGAPSGFRFGWKMLKEKLFP